MPGGRSDSVHVGPDRKHPDLLSRDAKFASDGRPDPGRDRPDTRCPRQDESSQEVAEAFPPGGRTVMRAQNVRVDLGLERDSESASQPVADEAENVGVLRTDDVGMYGSTHGRRPPPHAQVARQGAPTAGSIRTQSVVRLLTIDRKSGV